MASKQAEFKNFKPPHIQELDDAIEDAVEKQAEASETKKKAKESRAVVKELLVKNAKQLKGPGGVIVYGDVELVDKGQEIRFRKPRKAAKTPEGGEAEEAAE